MRRKSVYDVLLGLLIACAVALVVRPASAGCLDDVDPGFRAHSSGIGFDIGFDPAPNRFFDLGFGARCITPIEPPRWIILGMGGGIVQYRTPKLLRLPYYPRFDIEPSYIVRPYEPRKDMGRVIPASESFVEFAYRTRWNLPSSPFSHFEVTSYRHMSGLGTTAGLE